MSDGITDMYREDRQHQEWQSRRYNKGKKYCVNENAVLLVGDDNTVTLYTGKNEVDVGELKHLLKANVLKNEPKIPSNGVAKYNQNLS